MKNLLFFVIIIIALLFSCNPVKVENKDKAEDFNKRMRMFYYDGERYESAIIDLKIEELKNLYILEIDEEGFWGVPFLVYDMYGSIWEYKISIDKDFHKYIWR